MIVGIDLGTSTSEVSYLRNGKPELIREISGSSRGILPSVVALNPRGEIAVGENALGFLARGRGFAVQEAKRVMGTSERLQLGAEEYTPQEISAFILRHLKEQAEKYLGEPVTEAVITVPAYFKDAERQATQDAGELAGFRVRRIINEPTAAALAYGIERPGVEEKVLVYDLGGGTFDVTVLELSEGYLDVLATTGDARLGGKDFDEALAQHAAEHFRRAHGKDPLADQRIANRIKVEAKRVKEALSDSQSATFLLDNAGLTQRGDPIDFELEISRADFERLITPLVERTGERVREALAAKELQPSDINTILMIGGSTRVPLVQAFVSQLMGSRQLRMEVSPDEAVSLGAAIQAGIIDKTIASEQFVVSDVTAHSVGISIQGELDDAVVYGMFDPVIPQQTTIPRTAKKTYATVRDWQESVRVEVFEGEAEFCKDCNFITAFDHPMKPAPAGQSVEVEISYNLDGRIVIVVEDPSTGKRTTKEVRGASRLSDEDRAAAKARVDAAWRQGAPAGSTTAGTAATPAGAATRGATTERWRTSPLYPKVAALLTHAERAAADASPELRPKITRLVVELRAALEANDPAAVESREGDLTDLLFEMS